MISAGPDRGIVDFKSDKFKICVCGGTIAEYGLAYGPTPYLLHCDRCGKDINSTAYLITGDPENLYDYWNNHMADKTKEELDTEYSKFLKLEKKKKSEGYRIYKWYWYKGKGRHIAKSAF